MPNAILFNLCLFCYIPAFIFIDNNRLFEYLNATNSRKLLCKFLCCIRRIKVLGIPP